MLQPLKLVASLGVKIPVQVMVCMRSFERFRVLAECRTGEVDLRSNFGEQIAGPVYHERVGCGAEK